jgi:hypothetical protein
MPRRQKIAIVMLLFIAVFLALGDQYFSPPAKTNIAHDEPAFGLFQILIPGEDQLGKYCGETPEDTWLKRYYCDIKATDRYLVIFTFWLALATIALAFSTIALWIVSVRTGKRQSRETQILQRAYLSAEPRGVSAFLPKDDTPAKGDRVVAHVGFHNVGRLPARNVQWFLNMEYSDKAERSEFAIGTLTGKGNIVAPAAFTVACRRDRKPRLVERGLQKPSVGAGVVTRSDIRPPHRTLGPPSHRPAPAHSTPKGQER